MITPVLKVSPLSPTEHQNQELLVIDIPVAIQIIGQDEFVDVLIADPFVEHLEALFQFGSVDLTIFVPVEEVENGPDLFLNFLVD